MRLLKDEGQDKLSLVEYHDNDIPSYAILSHTWGSDNEEVTFKDMEQGKGESKVGYNKIIFCRKQAASDGLQHFWVDTCCIDKSSSTELTEAINSMFRWYQNAVKCYVYLSDVTTTGHSEVAQTPLISWKIVFRHSRWFKRGWTLQELIAPRSVEFFSCEHEQLGDKISLAQEICDITGVPVEALRGKSLKEFGVEERFTWADHRETKRQEDKVYSLLGLFDIFMPLIYGEGRENALMRLQKAIDKSWEPQKALVSSKRRLSDEWNSGSSKRKFSYNSKSENSLHTAYIALQHQVERHQPVYFVDALGRSSPFHLEFVRSVEALIAVLKANFQGCGPAAEMIQKGDFAITDIATGRDVDLRRKWDITFRPGQVVVMSLIFRRDEVQQVNSCPACKTDCPGSMTAAIQCQNCGTVFRRIVDETDPADSVMKRRQMLDGYSETTDFRSASKNPYAKLTAPGVIEPVREQKDIDDFISMFKNVRIVSSPRVNRSPKVWCETEVWAWHSDDPRREKRAGWCYIENAQNATIVLESHQEHDLALFVRHIRSDDRFEYEGHQCFLWYESFARNPGEVGGWFFHFLSRADLQVIWDGVRRVPGPKITVNGGFFPDADAAPLSGTESYKTALIDPKKYLSLYDDYFSSDSIYRR